MTTTARRQSDIGTRRRGERERAPIVRWGAVFAGAVIAIGMLFLLNSLWEALAFSSDIAWFRDTLNWWRAIDSIVVLAMAGFLAGWLARTPGWGAGLLNGVAAWGLLIAGAVVVGLGSNVATTSLAEAGSNIARPTPGSLWPTFAAYAIGLLAAAIGGLLGGSLPRPDFMYDSFDDDRSIDLRDERVVERRVDRPVDLLDEEHHVEGRSTPTAEERAEAARRARHDIDSLNQ